MIYIILDPKTCFIHMVTMDEALADQAMAELDDPTFQLRAYLLEGRR